MSLLLAEAGQDVTLVVLDELEGHGQVMVLQHRLVIVDQSELGAGVDQVLVSYPGVIHVMDRASQDSRQHLHKCQVLEKVLMDPNYILPPEG